MAIRRSKSQLLKEYRKNVKRIRQFMRYWEKRGVKFDEGIIPKRKSKTRVYAAEVDYLKSLKPATLLKKGKSVDIKTGEQISGYQVRENRRKEAAIKRKAKAHQIQDFEWDFILDFYRDYFSRFPQKISKMLIDNLETLIRTYGKRETALAYETMPKKIDDYITEESGDIYSSVLRYNSDVINYIPGLNERQKREVEEEWANEEDWETIGTPWEDI